MAKQDQATTNKKEKGSSAKTNGAKAEAEGFKASQFLKETKEELDKVVWPSRQQLISESFAVVLMVTLITTIIYLVDNFFQWASGQVFG